MDAPGCTVSVWYACVAWLEDSRLRRHCLSMLSADEQAAHARFRVRHAQEAYLLAHALCRIALSHHGGVLPAAWRFAPSQRGKPAIVAPVEASGLHFNISHSHAVVAVAVAPDHPVGVDVEQANRAVDVAKLGPKVLTAREYASCVAHAEPPVHFLRHWTLKEAYLKARGEGISDDLQHIDMRVEDDASDAPVRVDDTRAGGSSQAWHLRLSPVRAGDADCLLAAAVQASPQASRFVWSDAAALLNV